MRYHIFNYLVNQNQNQEALDIHVDGDIVDASTQAMLDAIFGDTVTTSYKLVRDQVIASKAKTINMYINSDGGHVGDALAIYDLLQNEKTKGKVVNTFGRGIIASSATLLLLASDAPEMSANSFFMIHPVSGGIYGNVNEVENFAATMRTFNTQIENLYVNKTGKSADEIKNLMNKETWFTAQQAKDMGFISNVSGDVQFSNAIDPAAWNHADRTILNFYNKSVKPVSQPQNMIEDMKKLFNNFQATIVAAIKGVKPTAETTNESLVNSIADAVGNAFAPLGEQLETGVNEQISNFFGTEAGKKVISDYLQSEAGKALIVGQIKKEDFEEMFQNEILDKIGGKTTTTTTNKETKPIGSFQ